MRKVSWPLWCAHSAAEKPARQLTRNESLPLLLVLAEWPCAGADDDLVTLAAVVRAAAVVAEGGGAGHAEAVLLAAGGEVLREEPLDPPAAGLSHIHIIYFLMTCAMCPLALNHHIDDAPLFYPSLQLPPLLF